MTRLKVSVPLPARGEELMSPESIESAWAEATQEALRDAPILRARWRRFASKSA